MSDVKKCSDCGSDFGNCRFSYEDGRVLCHVCEDALNNPLVQSLRQQLSTLTQERDALRECLQNLVVATEGEFHTVAGDQYHMLCPSSAIKVNTTTAWIVLATSDKSAHRNKDRVAAINAARTKALSLLTPSGEAGKGGGA